MIDTRQYRRFLSRGERFSEAIGKIRRPKVAELPHQGGNNESPRVFDSFNRQASSGNETQAASPRRASGMFVVNMMKSGLMPF
ncbi:MAG: hypothetical protein HY360_18970 [Verrucomicrobia bacterium]|nr:hypothetical protein [Verrucomicrobiota bacterium]